VYVAEFVGVTVDHYRCYIIGDFPLLAYWEDIESSSSTVFIAVGHPSNVFDQRHSLLLEGCEPLCTKREEDKDDGASDSICPGTVSENHVVVGATLLVDELAGLAVSA